MTILFMVLAAMTILAIAAAMSMRSAVHCVLALAIGLLGVGFVYLELGAQFVGFTQIMVYVGAVAILAVFAIMTTQRSGDDGTARKGPLLTASTVAGVLIALGVFGIIVWVVGRGGVSARVQVPATQVSVIEIGNALIHSYALPLEIVGLLLTAAMVGAVIVAMPEKGGRR